MAGSPIRATAVRPRGSWTATPADTVVLDFDDRHRRRLAMTGAGGLSFLLDLPDAVMLRSGDALALEDGRLVEVLGSPEPLAEIRVRDPAALVRLAWHIGNRHIAAQFLPKAIRIRTDHVIEDMVRNLGATVRAIEAPFDPEGGAYAAEVAAAHGGHGHDHEHEHDHRHGGHRHGHEHAGHGHAGQDHASHGNGHGHAAHGHDHGHRDP